MICCKCDNDLAKCTCDDMPERFESIRKSPFLILSPEYEKRIEAQAEKVRKSRPHIQASE